MITQNPRRARTPSGEARVAGDFSLHYLLEVIFRRKRIFFFTLTLTPLFAIVVSLLLPSTYMSTTTILMGRSEILNPLVRYETAVALTEENRLNSFQKIIYSRPLLEETIRRLHLARDIHSDLELERLVNGVRNSIQVFALTGDSFQIGCLARNPVLARDLVDAVSQLFIEKSLAGSRREAMAAVNFIQKQLDHYLQERSRIETALRDFRRDHADTLREAVSLNSQLTDYRAKALDAEIELNQERLYEKLLNDRLTGEKPMVVSQALYVQNTPYQKAYQEMQIRMGNLLATRERSHPEVIKLQREMDYITNLLEEEKKKKQAQETQEIRSPVFQEVLARLEDSRIKLKTLEHKSTQYRQLLADLEQKMKDIPELEREQARLEGEVRLTRELYDTLRVKLEQARVNCEVEIEQQANRFTIIDPPLVPLSRFKPKRHLFAIGGVAGGVVLGFLLVFLLEFTDPRIMRPGEILRRAGLPLLGMVPKLYRYGDAEPFPAWVWVRLGNALRPWLARWDALLRRRLAPALDFLRQRLATLAQHRFLRWLEPAGRWCATGAETVRRESAPLRRRLYAASRVLFCARRFVMPRDFSENFALSAARLHRAGSSELPEEETLDDFIQHIRSIGIAARASYDVPDHLLWMVASSKAGEGKSLFLANLGVVLASDLKRPVLVVDANLPNPALSARFGRADAPGFADVIEGRVTLDQALIAAGDPNLYFLAAGHATEYPEVLFHTAAFRELLAQLRARFPLTLIEAPGLVDNSEGVLLAPHTDGILLVTQLYNAKRHAVEAALRKIPAEKVIGMVANYAEYWIPNWLYKWV